MRCTTRRPRTRSGALLAGVAGALLAGSPALAQRALGTGNALDANNQVGSRKRNDGGQARFLGQVPMGSGNALDANPLVGSGGINFGGPSSNLRAEMQLRNAIVVGTAPGGKSFRGDVGYSSEFDFRGNLGSNDLFEFQRDSIYSGLATNNVRGITGLQYQLGQSVFGQTARPGGADLIVQRSGAGASAQEVSEAPALTPKVNQWGQFEGSLRSTSQYWLTAYENPSVLDIISASEDGEMLYTAASPLHGVRQLASTDPAFGADRDPYRMQRLQAPRTEEELPSGAVQQFDRLPGAETDEEESPRPTRAPSTRIESDNLAHDAIIEAYVQQAERFDTRVTPETGAEEIEPGEEPPAPEADVNRMLDSLRDSFQPIPEPGELPEDEEAPTEEELEAARELLKDGAPNIARLLEPGRQIDNIYELHMQKGEAALREGRWFDAEERFTFALDQRKGDPMAAAGRVVAQIGAGMFRSAGPNLRNLFSAYPELIPAKFDSALMPGVERLARIRGQLRDRVERETFIANEAALLLAFIGYQTDNPDDVAFGLDTLVGAAEEAGREPDNLLKTLREVWLP